MSNGLSSEVRWHEQKVTTQMRAEVMQQRGACIWFTGLSGAGKSTLANALDVALYAAGRKTYLLDGDNVRHGLCRDLGMAEADRAENIRRAGEVAKLMVDAGLIVLCAFISPYRRDRERLRAQFQPGQFVEVHVSTPLDLCEQRDPKGLYSKARQGLISDFTGIDSPYEVPPAPEFVVDTSLEPLDLSIRRLLGACAY
ncbi:adenylylsulfate kinase [Pseudomonas sp. ATCC 13867]|uniref:adenylyl-sulfate kinase n=1 Tax=Pseudomonas sp. ATCC 13867 TaxID=1294143 RepID=UPI0002C4DD6C|nr:adenylyl-sulfate kinase [Pseudomonas sp. ATCC 13867]AGI26116.1 adenylylsulfate kinase [Pseudomonas sp. ATCC 13867]RFQ20233.1 adenylyl-sulfate kinase [Pseudomonas sp. ATCC 13867]